jgi:hypothetical protein
MRPRLIAVGAAVALAAAPMLTGSATAASADRGSWSFTDYSPDPGQLAAAQAFYVVTGHAVTSYCRRGRVPTTAQDVNAHPLHVSAPAVLQVHVSTTGAWGVEVDTRRGAALAGVASGRQSTGGLDLRVRLRPGTYAVNACNLGGGPEARADYRLTPTS